jgi:hypothetical protein
MEIFGGGDEADGFRRKVSITDYDVCADSHLCGAH